MTRLGFALVGCLSLLLGLAPAAARADDGEALFALVIGVNQGVDRNLPLLHYADDDAARFFDLFRVLGARTTLLSALDANTRRLHPQAAAEAQRPRRAAFEAAVGTLARDVRVARERRLRSVLYLVYAGHGNERDGQSYISLEDERLTAEKIEAFVATLGADRTHIIVDACQSEFLAQSRGAGGSRRRVEGFSRIGRASLGAGVGLLLSTSPSRETHEWAAFQAGVFSHTVRSGLYGAADADGDGQVSYREIAAFVHRANEAIPNERFRSLVYAQPPRGSVQLLDLRRVLRRAIQVEPSQHGRYLLEDTRGVRLADFHSGRGQRVRLVRPASGLLYLRRSGDELEWAVPPSAELVSLAALTPATPRTAVRGAAHHAFSLLFSLPFDSAVVAGFSLPEPAPPHQTDRPVGQGRPRWRRIAGWSALGVGAASLATGLSLSLSALSLRNGVPPNETHADRVKRNEAIDRRNIGAVVLYSVAGGSAIGAALLFLWPKVPVSATARIGEQEASIAVGGRF